MFDYREPMQRSFDDLGTPLCAVTFAVIDIETTGGAAVDGGITEVGAVKVCGGECLGTFQTFVNPGQAIPPSITVLTGITQSMVLPAPRIETRAAVVARVRARRGDRGAQRPLRPRLPQRGAGARRAPSVRQPVGRHLCPGSPACCSDDVPNCRLGTLADRLRLAHRPAHRALADALATADLLHLLLERAAGLGVLGLDDLLALPTIAGHPQLGKLRLTDNLPRKPGVYLFRDRGGRTLYVGKATNLRSRVRSYFSGEQRRKIGQLLRETHRIDHVVCASPLEAAVLEVRLIHRFEPRFNRQSKTWRSYAYLKLTAERFPRLSVVRTVRAGWCPLHRSAPVEPRRQARRRGDRDCGTVASMHDAAGRSRPHRAMRSCATGRRHMPVRRAGERAGVCRHRGPGAAGSHERAVAAARPARAADATAGQHAPIRGGGRDARTSVSAGRRPCAASAASRRSRRRAGC